MVISALPFESPYMAMDLGIAILPSLQYAGRILQPLRPVKMRRAGDAEDEEAVVEWMAAQA
jgi:hypothetical protein